MTEVGTHRSLDIGTVVKIVEIKKPVIHEILKLRDGMEGIVQYHNKIFECDHDSISDQRGPNDEPMYDFVMPGSGIRIGPVMKMPEDHKVIVWIVGGKMWNVTNLNILFNDSLRWFVTRSGETLTLK